MCVCVFAVQMRANKIPMCLKIKIRNLFLRFANIHGTLRCHWKNVYITKKFRFFSSLAFSLCKTVTLANRHFILVAAFFWDKDMQIHVKRRLTLSQTENIRNHLTKMNLWFTFCALIMHEQWAWLIDEGCWQNKINEIQWYTWHWNCRNEMNAEYKSRHESKNL